MLDRIYIYIQGKIITYIMHVPIQHSIGIHVYVSIYIYPKNYEAVIVISHFQKYTAYNSLDHVL